MEPSLPSLEQDFRRLLKKTRKELDDLVAEEKRKGISVKELIREGKPHKEIEKVVRDEKIGLLVLPAHEESRLEHLPFGRDNEDLIRGMPCSILLVKREPKPAPYPWPS
ncbi:MAG TPA: universal stress protein [Nitrospirota bacterium]|nr:universal stress protein [Nitrospirota bacterium]